MSSQQTYALSSSQRSDIFHPMKEVLQTAVRIFSPAPSNPIRLEPPSPIYANDGMIDAAVRSRRRQDYRARLERLSICCAEESTAINADSESDLWIFFDMIGYELAFGIFSDDDGFLEVVWDGIDSRVAVTFRGEGQCEYAAWGPNTEPTTGHKGIYASSGDCTSRT